MRSLAITLACCALVSVPTALTAQERKCNDMRNPKRLPPLGLLIDSARAVAGFVSSGVPAAGLDFSLLYSETDSFPIPRALDAVAERAVGVLPRTVLPQKPVGLWAVRVRVSGGPTPALTLARSVYCPPVLIESSVAPVTPSVTVRPEGAAGDRLPTLRRPKRVVVEIMVAETGDATDIRVSQSSGVRDLDDAIVRLWQTRRFLPASIDGVPFPALYRVCIAPSGTHRTCEQTTP